MAISRVGKPGRIWRPEDINHELGRLKDFRSEGVRRILSDALRGQKLIEVQRLFSMLSEVKTNQKQPFFHQLNIQGLDTARERLTPEQKDDQVYAFELRFFLEQVFGCGLAYRKGDRALVIRTAAELKTGIKEGSLLFHKPVQSEADYVKAAAAALPAISPPVAGQEIIVIEEPAAVSTFQRNVVEDVVTLINKREYETAALLAFYGKTPQKAWETAMQVSQAEDLELKDSIAMLRLAMDVNSVEGRTIPSPLMVMAALFENYLPKESARLMKAWVDGGLVSTAELADIFALLEARGEHGRQVCAVIMLRMAGERNHGLVNRLFQESYSREIISYSFEQILSTMNATCRSGICKPEEYKGKGSVFKSNIFLSQLRAVFIDIRKSIQTKPAGSEQGIIPYDASLADIFALRNEVSVDESMKREVRRLLTEGEAKIAAEIAFGDRPVYEQMYLNMRYCFTPAESGQMLAALDKEVLSERLAALYVGRPADYEEALEVLGVLLRAFQSFGGEVSEEETIVLFDELILEGENQPNVRFAAYWLLQNGVAYFDFTGLEADAENLQGFYIAVVDRLAELHEAEGWRDLDGFMANCGFMETDPPDQDRTAQIKFYMGIVSDAKRSEKDRIFGLKMLWTLRSVESLPDLRKVLAADLKAKSYTEFSMRTARVFFDLCEELDLGRKDHQKLYRPAAAFLKAQRDELVDLFGEDFRVGEDILVKTDEEWRSGVLEKAKFAREKECLFLSENTFKVPVKVKKTYIETVIKGDFISFISASDFYKENPFGLLDNSRINIIVENRIKVNDFNGLTRIAVYLVASGRVEEALLLVKREYEEARKAKVNFIHDDPMDKVLTAMFVLGYFDRALHILMQEIDGYKPDIKMEVLRRAAIAMGRVGRFNEALLMTREKLDGAEKIRALGEIAVEMTQAGRLDDALAIVRREIPEGYFKSERLEAISIALAQAGRFDDALEIAQSELHGSYTNHALQGIVVALASTKASKLIISDIIKGLKFATTEKPPSFSFDNLAVVMAQVGMPGREVKSLFEKNFSENLKILLKRPDRQTKKWLRKEGHNPAQSVSHYSMGQTKAIAEAGYFNWAIRIINRYLSHGEGQVACENLAYIIYRDTNPQTKDLTPAEVLRAWVHTRVYAVLGMESEFSAAQRLEAGEEIPKLEE